MLTSSIDPPAPSRPSGPWTAQERHEGGRTLCARRLFSRPWPIPCRSIDFLRHCGIDFERHTHEGIDVQDFAELLMSSGVVLNEDVPRALVERAQKLQLKKHSPVRMLARFWVGWYPGTISCIFDCAWSVCGRLDGSQIVCVSFLLQAQRSP